MPVNSRHPDYDLSLDAIKTTRDASAGQKQIKRGTTRYLPEFHPADPLRYEKYLQRAYYVNVVGRTKSALIGAIFRRPIKVKLPERIEYLKYNANGQGMSLEQIAKLACEEILESGRYGFLVDYPTAPDGSTAADTAALQSNIIGYSTENIRNWDTEVIDGQERDTLIVLEEEKKVYSDRFTWSIEEQYRVLELKDNVYVQRLYNTRGDLLEEFIPRINNQPIDYIPFYFAGAQDNRSKPDEPPLFDLANVNIAHYRNCADYEEGTHLHGQPMLVVDTGDTTAQEFEALNPNGVTVGSRRGLALQRGKAQLLQAEANGAAHEAMLSKEDQMIAIGARLINQRGVNQTAESARIAASSEASILNSIVGNVGEALQSACESVANFMDVDIEEVFVALNRDFFDSSIDANQAMMLIQFADRGDIAKSDVRAKLREAGWLEDYRSDEIIDDEVEENPPMMMSEATGHMGGDDMNAAGITEGFNRETGRVES